MKKSCLIFIFLIFLFIASKAQQDVQFSQYMLNPIYYNSASAGLDGTTNFSAIYRLQWLVYSSSFDGNRGAPSSQLLSFSTPFLYKGIPLGLGFNFIHDKLGEVRNLSIGFAVAYHKKLKKGKLSIGIKPELISQTIDFTKLRFNDPIEPLSSNAKESQIAPDLSMGVFYSKKDYIIGIGVNHILKPSFDFGLSNSPFYFHNNLERTLNITGKYTYDVAYDIILSPSVLIKTDFKTYTFDIGVLTTYDDKMWAGLSYRQQEAIILILGYSFMKDNMMKVGYAFDYIINEQKAKQPTSHEVFIKYTLPLLVIGGKKIIRTPRFRF